MMRRNCGGQGPPLQTRCSSSAVASPWQTVQLASVMAHPLEQLREDALGAIALADNEQALEAVRVKFLGKSGTISAWGEQMKTLGKEEKPIVGKLLNEVRTAVTSSLDAAGKKLQQAKEAATLATIDISLP